MEEQPARVMFNAEEAALYLGGPPITASTLVSLARQRKIGFVKVGRATVFPKVELDAYITAHTMKPVENPWGLTDQALRNVRDGRLQRRRAD